MTVRVLLVDDDDDARAIMARTLRGVGHQVVEATDGDEALAFDLTTFDIILSDLQMPRVGGRDVLAAARAQSPLTPVVIFTAYANAEGALDLLTLGAYDYLPRPVDLTRLKLLVLRASEWRRLQLENAALRQQQQRPTQRPGDPQLVGTSPAMLNVYKVVAQVAPTTAPVLLVGEAGTGKELLARTIHQRSGRAGPFLSVSCATLPEAVLTHELFGYEAGAVPGIPGGKRSLFEEAHEGTLFIDDLEAMPPKVQALLRKVLEEKAVRHVGSQQPIGIDTRLVTATRADLTREVARGDFREDLLFRLQVVTVQVPPLSARREDVPLLVEHFLQHYAALLGRSAPMLAGDARQILLDYDWPGNVRELAQTVERAMLLARGNVILKDDLPNALRHADAKAHPTDGLDTDWPTLSVVERRYIDRVLQHTGGNKTRAAEVLGIDRRTLSRLFARERATGEGEGEGEHDEAASN
ncbi:MAG: sigma-54-dependent Fis family transcriptional regulator [Myxococcales bacterium]|nr:sigma-54-dependent Fis family transcriptional regulator [Myxococcales bacterium]